MKTKENADKTKGHLNGSICILRRKRMHAHIINLFISITSRLSDLTLK